MPANSEVAVEHVEPVLVLTTADGVTGGIVWSGILIRNVSRHDAKAHIGHENSSLTHGHVFQVISPSFRGSNGNLAAVVSARRMIW